ncbi:PAS domain-containing protein-containing protein [Lipomyces japonicus]|uniref:PAS domain-containing protein-containing protein n=1 Tax=Lipomyces japonicus TaxID=56871 RepID=UPI0034CFA29F
MDQAKSPPSFSSGDSNYLQPPSTRSRSLSPATIQSTTPVRRGRNSSFSFFGSPRRDRSVSGSVQHAGSSSGWARPRHVNVILELDLDCNVIWASRSWTHVVGNDISDFIGKPISDALVGETDVFQKATDAMLETNSSFRVRFTTARGDLSHDFDALSVSKSTSTSYATSPRQPDFFPAFSKFSPDSQQKAHSISLPTTRASTLNTMPTTTRHHSTPIASSVLHDHSNESSKSQPDSISPLSKTIELEGQGIIIFDRNSLEPCYSMWVLKPYREPITPVVDLPRTLVDSLGFGADFLAAYISRITQAGITDTENFPMQDPIMCRICERQIQPWWFERHSELCLVEHKAESEVQNCQDILRDHRTVLFEILEKADAQDENNVPEYRGRAIPISRRAHSNQKFTMSLKHLAKGHPKSPIRVLEILLDLCDTSLEVSIPALRDNNLALPDSEGYYQIRVHSPSSESKVKQVLNWRCPSTIEDEGLITLCRDTERFAKSKIESVLRLGNTITYSEKIQRELSILVQETIEDAVSQIIDHQRALMDDVSESEMDDITASEIDEPGFFDTSQENLRNEGENSPITRYLSSSMSVASGSSPFEVSTPKSFATFGGFGSDRRKSRKYALQDEDGGDSDSSRSSLVYVRENANSPVSEPETTNRILKARKSSSNLFFGSPARTKSPSLSHPKSPLLNQQIKFSSFSDASGNASETMNLTPLTSPLLFPIDSYTDHGSRHHHRRKSSAASDFARAPASPLLSSVTPAIRPAQPSIKDFEVIKPISRGAFGSVYLTRKKNTGEYFAIKVLKKADMIAKNQVTNVKAERAIMMAQAESPFVAKLFFTFQSKEYLYLVMEYLNGGDCAALLKAFGGGLPEDWVQKYIAEVVLGIENLHDKGIVHRDLKPDNLLIDKHGHLKMTDFGLSRMGLVGRQTRARNAITIEPPDIFQGHFGTSGSSTRSTSVSSQSGSMDTPMYLEGNVLAVSPWSTPQMLPDSASLPQVPGYFSLSKSATSEQGPMSSLASSHNTGAVTTVAAVGVTDVNTKGESIQSMLDSFRLNSSSSSKSGKDEDIFSGPNSSLMPPPPPPATAIAVAAAANMALFNPGAGKRFVGTPDYLAPETITGTGQDEMSDWWSLGCIVFEFLYGYPPFHAATPDQVFENILARKINWPDDNDDDSVSPPVSDAAIDLINRLICLDPAQRLGAGSAEQVKNHKFFEDINWASVCEEEAAFIPRPENAEDTAYFDDRGATLQTFPEEDNEDGGGGDGVGNEESAIATDDDHDSNSQGHQHSLSSGEATASTSSSKRRKDSASLVGNSTSVAPVVAPIPSLMSRTSKILPLHIPHHFRGRRVRRQSEPAGGGDDFGSFSFKNLPVLEKANKDVIQRLKSEHLEHMQHQQQVQPSSGPVESSPVKSRTASVNVAGLGAPLSLSSYINSGNRPARPGSPSSMSSSSTSSVYRSVSPNRNVQVHHAPHGLSIPSSPLTTSIPINAVQSSQEDSNYDNNNNDEDVPDDEADRQQLPAAVAGSSLLLSSSSMTARSATGSPVSSRKVSSSSSSSFKSALG